MTILNTSDFEYYISKEATVGNVPATPALTGVTLTEFEFNLEAGKIESPEITPNRAAGDSRIGMKEGKGSLGMVFRRATGLDMLLEILVSGTWNANTLKAGKVDASYSVFKKLAPEQWQIFKGTFGTTLSISAGANEMLQAKSEFLFMEKGTAETALPVADATYPVVVEGEALAGPEAVVSIVGLENVDFRKFDFKVEQSRNVLPKLSSTLSAGVAASGNRKTTLSVTFYRNDLAVEALDLTTPFDIMITIGAGVDGYSIRLPRAFASFPQDSDDDGAAMVTIDFTAAGDATQNTDLIISKLV